MGTTFRLALLCFACSASLVRADELTLAITIPTNSVFAGQPVRIWLNALNPSTVEITWSAPEKISCHVASQQGAMELSATLRDATNVASIAPGGFARRGYDLPVPDSWAGPVTLSSDIAPGTQFALNVAPLDKETTGASQAKPTKRDLFGRDKDDRWEPEEFFKEHIFGYEPLYFLAGTKSPNAKFQISFKYRLLNEHGYLADHADWLKGFHVAYTQTSLWDWSAPSAPFYDTSYKPGLIYSWEKIVGGEETNWFQLDLHGGFQHESNGKDGANSRSMNIAFLRPTLIFGRPDKLQLQLQPRAWVYLGDLSDNPDLPDYRGYADLRAVLGWKRDLQISALGRLGDHGNHGSVQVDLTYPLMRPPRGSFSVYLDAQYFVGYGESLLGYRGKSEILRFGFSLYR
jgi:phospholipase A1